MVVDAHAKINLTLEVLGRRPDGYHDLRSVVLPIHLSDEIDLAPADETQITVYSSLAGDCPHQTGNRLPQLETFENLAVKALRLLQRIAGRTDDFHISITKRIPLGAGLGGGSADAAAVLNALNDDWHLGISRTELAALSVEIGSDVPALVLGGPVLMEGRGERVTPLAASPCANFPLPDLSRLILRTPPIFVSTPSVFREFRPSDRGRGKNDLQPAACRLHPEIAAALEALHAEGCEDVMMSGSGSSVFGWRHLASV